MNNVKKRFFFLQPLSAVLLALSLLILVGCAPPVKELRTLVWPRPPHEPRIKFVRSFKNMKGASGVSVADILLGADPVSGGGFTKPFGLHADSDGRVYVTDTQRSTVQIFDFANGIVTNVGLGKVAFDNPMSIATDSTKKIYVTDSKKDKLYIFNQGGEFLKVYGKDGVIERPVGLVINEDLGRIYIGDINKHHIVVLDLKTGEHLFNFSQRGQRDGDLNLPTFMAKNDKGDIFVVDFNGRVTVFDQDGRFLRTIGQYGDVSGEFARPKGIAFDSDGHLYVVDAAFNNVQIFDEEGRILLAFAGFGDKRGQMILPAGIAIDSKDQIYITDQWNRKVHVFQYLSDNFKKENPEEWEKLSEEYKKYNIE